MYSADDIRQSLKDYQERRRLERKLKLYRAGFWLVSMACLVIWLAR